MKTFALIPILLATSVLAQTVVRQYPYDDTEAVTNKLSLIRKGSELRLARPHLVAGFVCGAYYGYSDATAGFTLHVFPDKTAMIEEWSDVGIPKLFAEGRWHIGEKGEVLFDWKKEYGEDIAALKLFLDTYGECRKMRLFLCFSGRVAEDVVLVSSEMVRPEIEHAYYRRTEYVDWQRIRNGLRTK